MNNRARNLGRSVLVMVALAMLAGAAIGQDGNDNRAVNWLSYREALAAGRDNDRPIMLHFTASYSPICRRMRIETYQDPQVIRYLNENFAVAMVDIEQLPSLARKYKVDSVPVLWFLDASGKALTSINGEVGPQKMLRVTEYIKQKIYEHTDYNTWLGHRKAR